MATPFRRHDTALSDMNITPLVDVMLVLLIIFMVASPLLTQRLALTLPGGTPRHADPVAEPRRLELDAGGVLRLDGHALTPAQAASALRGMAGSDPGRVLAVDIHPDTDYQSAHSTLALARNAGVQHLRIVGL